MWKYVRFIAREEFSLSLYLSKSWDLTKKEKIGNNFELARIFMLPRDMQSRLLHSSRTGGNSIPQ